MKTKSGICYRVEWLHNYQWRMELNDKGTFATRPEAKAYEKEIKRHSSPGLKTRIIKLLATKEVRS